MAGRLHQLRGLGYASRFRISPEDLPPGWRQEKKSSRFTVWYDDKGTKYKSSVEVQRALQLRDLASDRDVQTAIESGGTTTESGCESTEFEISPLKMPPRTDV